MTHKHFRSQQWHSEGKRLSFIYHRGHQQYQIRYAERDENGEYEDKGLIYQDGSFTYINPIWYFVHIRVPDELWHELVLLGPGR